MTEEPPLMRGLFLHSAGIAGGISTLRENGRNSNESAMYERAGSSLEDANLALIRRELHVVSNLKYHTAIWLWVAGMNLST